MYKGVNQFIDSSELLNVISQEQIFLDYLGFYPDLNKRYKSPFRNDKDPGCRFIWYSGLLYFVDNATYKNKLYWSIFDIVREIKQCSYQECLNYILESSDKQVISKDNRVYKLKTKIRFTSKEFIEDNIFGLHNAVLNKELIYSVQDYWIQEKGEWTKNKYHNPHLINTIAYHFPETNNVKLYFPNQEFRWYSNCSNNDIFGWNKLHYYSTITKQLVITKSQKDRIYLDYHLNIPSIALQNEGSYIPEDKVKLINSLFSKVIFLYDNDFTGIDQSQKLADKYNWEYRILECEYKDTFEFYTKDKEGCQKYMHNLLKK